MRKKETRSIVTRGVPNVSLIEMESSSVFSRATTMRIELQKSTKQVVQRLVFSSMNTGREIRIDFFLDYNFELYSRYV